VARKAKVTPKRESRKAVGYVRVSTPDQAEAGHLDAAHAALPQKFPRILAVVYFHSNREHDWTLYDEPDALAAFRRMALDPYFNPPPVYPRH
jgi:hypothetical protein